MDIIKIVDELDKRGYYKTTIDFYGEERAVAFSKSDDDDHLTEKHKATLEHFNNLWTAEFQLELLHSIIKYYKEKEYGWYGPADEKEEWSPEIDTPEQMLEQLIFDRIILPPDFLYEDEVIFLTFSHKWGHDMEYEDNGIGVEICNGKINNIGYKDIAY